MKLLYWVFIFYSTVLFAYTMKFQQATLYWGKRIAPYNELLPAGLQDAITPKSQTNRNIISVFLLIIAAVAGFFIFRWYVGIIGPVIVLFLGAFILGAMRLKPSSSFFKNRILNDLTRRLNEAKTIGDAERTIALEEVIRRMNDAENVG